jgi:hypothetical protein
MNKHVEKMGELQEKNIELEKNIKHYKSIAVLCPITQEPIINEVVNVVDGQKYEKEGECFPFSYVLDPFFGDATVTRCRHPFISAPTLPTFATPDFLLAISPQLSSIGSQLVPRHLPSLGT